MSVCSWECWLLLWNMKMSTGCDIWESLFSEWIILKWDYHQGADAKRSRSRSVHRHRRQCLLACAYCGLTHINAGQNEALGYYLKCITQRRRCILLESEGCRGVSQAFSLLWTMFLEIFLATQESQKNINKRMTWIIKEINSDEFGRTAHASITSHLDDFFFSISRLNHHLAAYPKSSLFTSI